MIILTPPTKSSGCQFLQCVAFLLHHKWEITTIFLERLKFSSFVFPNSNFLHHFPHHFCFPSLCPDGEHFILKEIYGFVSELENEKMVICFHKCHKNMFYFVPENFSFFFAFGGYCIPHKCVCVCVLFYF